MTAKEKRQAIINKVISREGKNSYTQGSRRDQVASGYSDCSSLVRWAYKEAVGIDIGDNTESQINTSRLVTTSVPIRDGVPDESQMLPGDLLYYRGRDTGRKASQYVGHVEMYVGNGQISGHGSGIGPTRKDMAAYCRQRQSSSSPVPAGNRGLICVRRAVLNDDANTTPAAPAAEEGDVSIMRDLVRGDKGYGEIATLQRCLKSLGYYDGAIDHSFGGGTEQAVKAFQKAKGIQVNYPGTVGPKTWKTLLTEC